MASVNSIIATFIEDNQGLEINDKFVSVLKALIIDCIDIKPKITVSVKVQKIEKLESAADAVSLDELTSGACNLAMLADYCREHGLRVSGPKTDAAARVWRHICGESEEDDTSPRNRAKKEPVKKEKHDCFACNTKNKPCGLPATQQFEGEWFCYKHIDTAEEIINPLPKPKVVKRPSAAIKKAVVSE
jgi:hypothetical protein